MVKFFTSFGFCEKFNYLYLEWGHFRWRHFFKKFLKTCLRSPIRSQNWKPHNPSNIYDNSAQCHVAFQNLCVSSGSGPTGIGDEIKPKKTQKVTKLHIFKTHQNTYKEPKLQNLKTCKSVLPQALVMRGLKKVYFRTLELLEGFEEIPLF